MKQLRHLVIEDNFGIVDARVKATAIEGEFVELALRGGITKMVRIPRTAFSLRSDGNYAIAWHSGNYYMRGQAVTRKESGIETAAA